MRQLLGRFPIKVPPLLVSAPTAHPTPHTNDELI